MTPLATTPLDLVDLAFLRRAESLARPSAAAPAPAAPVSALLAAWTPLPRATTLVERLLGAVPGEWQSLAERVEESCAHGTGVIAVAGGCPGEGRSTVVACLARTLADRGHAVEVHDRAPVEVPPASGRERYSIALVDAGVWFSGGPLRRSWLAKRSLGCQAAILVRRADAPEWAGREAALAAVGVVVLGEVLTMAPPTTHSIRVA
jgi:hypothetical protein